MPKGQQQKDNPEKLATQCTQNDGKHTKNTTRVFNYGKKDNNISYLKKG